MHSKPHIYYEKGAWWCHVREFNGHYRKVGFAWRSPLAAYADWVYHE
jgi:hypothetical protein